MPVEVADVGVGASGGLARRRVERRQARLTQRQVERRQRQQARPRGRVDHLPLERSGQAAVRQVGVVKGRDQPRRVLARRLRAGRPAHQLLELVAWQPDQQTLRACSIARATPSGVSQTRRSGTGSGGAAGPSLRAGVRTQSPANPKRMMNDE